ncbi:MAG: SGNH/GDSL hydrolase family protein [Oscillospiraceae bacterium]
MRRYMRITALILAAALLCGCASNESRKAEIYTGKIPVELGTTENTSAVTTAATTAATAEDTQSVSGENDPKEQTDEPEVIEAQTQEASTTGEDTSPADEPEEITQEEIAEQLDLFYKNEFGAYQLTEAERSYTEQSIFVGDSICRGFAAYNVVSGKNVYACGSLAARSFWDYKFYYGEKEVEYKTVLKKTKPKYVFLSMGMNDINITDEKTYCENYRRIIDYTLERTDGVVYVCAITPICSEFSSNYRIDCFNLALQAFVEENYPERVFYVDFAKHLKEKDGKLRIIHSSGDGIHLGPYAYYIALWEINRTMIADGNWNPYGEDETAEITEE